MAKDIIITPLDGDIVFDNSLGTECGSITQDGDNLVISNAVGDVLLGDGASDIYIGDGTNNVDILFEQSGAIKAEDGSTGVTLTIGSGDTTLVLESPTLNTPAFAGASTINNSLTLTTTNSKIIFDHEESGTTGEYTTEVPLLQIDRSGTPITILSRVSSGGAIVLGADDMVHIAAGDTKAVIKDNLNMAGENVVLSSEFGFTAYGFPSNDTSWANRNEFRFRSDSGTSSENGLYIGDGGNTQFIDVSRNLSVVNADISGNITASGNISASGNLTGLSGSLSVLGVGTTTPAATVQIVDGGLTADNTLNLNDRVKFRGDGAIFWGSSANYGLLNWSGNDALFGAQSGKNLNIYANGGSKMFVSASGNVGIGTTSPQADLQVGSVTASFYSLSTGKADFIDTDKVLSETQMGTLNVTSNSRSVGDNSDLGPSITFSQNVSQYVDGYEKVIGGIKSYITTSGNTGENSSLGFYTHNGSSLSERLTINSSGNVGIGTTEPNEKLDVNGNITVSGTVDGRDVATDGTKLDTIATNADVTPSWVPSSDPSYLTAETNSFLGDGGTLTTSPGYNKLIYTGQISNGVSGLFPASNNSNSIITLNRHSGNYDSQLGFSSNGNVYYRNFANTAINTTQGWRQLLITDTNGNIVPPGTVDGVDIAARDAVLTSTTTTANAALPKAGGTMSGAIAMGSNNITGGGTITGTTLYGNHADGSGSSLKLGRADNSNYWLFNHAGDDLRIYNTAAANSNILLGVDAGGSEEANSVGIGTASPSQKLHVAGNARVTGAYYDSNNSAGTSGQVLSSTATGTDWVSLSEISGVDGTGTANYVTKWSDADTITNSVIYDNGTNVGIGTTTPTEALQVTGDISASGDIHTQDKFVVRGSGGLVRIENPGWTSAANHDILYNGWTSDVDDYVYLKAGGNSTSNHGIIAISDAGGFFVGNTDTEYGASTAAPPFDRLDFRVDIAGNVTASGNISASGTGSFSRLQVGTEALGTYVINAGSGYSKIGGVDIGSGTIFPTSIRTTTIYDKTSTSYSSIFFAGADRTITFMTSGSNRMKIDSDGNVGIGTTTPPEKLTVEGNISASGEVNIDSAAALFSSKLTISGDAYTTGGWKLGSGATYVGKAYNNSGIYSIEADTNRDIQFGDAGTPAVMYIDNLTEKVGIGTTSPSEKLEVVGNISASGTITADTYFASSDAAVVLAPASAGSCYLRPNGVGSGTGAFSVSSAGKATVNGELEATSLDINGDADISGNVVVSGTVDGRDVATDGTKLDGIEASATADQTAAEIRTAVEAATDSNVFTDAYYEKLNAIEASADVTDATNVTAAGALMDSELTNLAAVKAINQSLVTTGTPTFATLTTTNGTIFGTEGGTHQFTGALTVTGDVSSSGTITSLASTTTELTVGSRIYTTLGGGTGNSVVLNSGGELYTDEIDAGVWGAAGAVVTAEGEVVAPTATLASTSTLVATTDNAEFFVTLVDGASGAQALETSTKLKQNPSTGKLTVTGDVSSSGTIVGSNLSGTNTGDQSTSDVLTLIEDGVDSVHYKDGSIDTIHIGDDQVTFAKASGVSPNVYGNYIKLIPSDFETNGDGGNTKFGMAFDKTAGEADYGMRTSDNTQEVFAFVSIPEGMKATHVEIYGKRTKAVEVFEVQINATTVVSKGTGTCTIPGGSSNVIAITNVSSTATNLLAIEVVITSNTADRIYGGAVTIAAI